MKKQLLVLAAAVSLSASTSLASDYQSYIKANAGYAKFNNEKLKEGAPINKSHKMKAESGGATFGIGAGYYITDIIRADVMLDYFANIEHKNSVNYGLFKSDGSLESNSLAAMVNGYVDFANVGDVKFFAGAGIGAVRTLAKLQRTTTNVSSGTV